MHAPKRSIWPFKSVEQADWVIGKLMLLLFTVLLTGAPVILFTSWATPERGSIEIKAGY
jgi:hypothetical protein